MRTRSLSVALSLLALVLLVVTRAQAAPEAHIIRIDPRASFSDGAPVLTVVVDLVQSKPVGEVTKDCADMRGDKQLDCQSEALEQSKALYQVFPFPEKNANFLVTVDGAARPTKFVWKARWGDSLKQTDVGTAWLIAIDASGSMGNRLNDAKAIASAFVNAMGPNDIVNVVAFSDSQVVKSSNWIATPNRAAAVSFAETLPLYPTAGRNRPLFNLIKQAVNDGFKTLGNVGSTVKVPLHQALVVLSNGSAGTDPMSTGPGAETLKQHLSAGRFPDGNSAMPKTPLPVISIWFPLTQIEEFRENAQQFMTNLANPEMGGFYTVVRMGQGSRAGRIVGVVRERFNQMNIVKYRVSCIAPNVSQTFQLVFNNVKPPIIGDSSFKDVPVGIDPTTWPLDVNSQYTVDMAKKDPVRPGGSFKVWGDFCWGGDKGRAEVYFLPKNQPAPPTVEGGDVETAKRAQQQLIAMKMNGKAVQVADTFVEFEAPDSDKILLGSGDNAVVRFVIFDNKAARTSPVDQKNILTLKAESAPFPFVWVGVGVFGLAVVALLLLAVLRGSPKRGGAGVPPPAPIVAGGAQPYPGVPPGQPFGAGFGGQPPMGGPPVGFGMPPQVPPPFGAMAPGPAPVAPAPGEFPYGGQQPPFGAPGMQAMAAAPPMMGAPMMPGASRAVISGTAGTFQILPGTEMAVGRDGARCQVFLQEPRISGVHAILRFENGQLLVRDEGSNNGTFLNGNRLPAGVATPVPPGSMLRFGPVEFAVRLE